MIEKMLKIKNDAEAKQLFGRQDEVLKKLEKTFSVSTVFRNGELKIGSEQKSSVEKAQNILSEFLVIIRRGGQLSAGDIDYSMRKYDDTVKLNDIFLDRITVGAKRAGITPRTHGQKMYVDAMRKNDVVFCVGPAGTGKTYLAVAMALNALKENIVTRIVLTRPAVEAGESLGFLPGDMHAKVNPYLRPLYDALYEMVENNMVRYYIDNGVIEVAPLAFMRGRTLNDSFIIMDEAQNSTPEQMKMFLTRLGLGSKAVITGDITQSDLPRDRVSGLAHAQSILQGTEGINFVVLKGSDVVRHEVVRKIIEVYAKAENKKREKDEPFK